MYEPALHKLLREIGFRPLPPVYASFLQWLLISIPMGVFWTVSMDLLFWHRVPILAKIGLGAFHVGQFALAAEEAEPAPLV